MREPMRVFSPADPGGSKVEKTEAALPLHARLDEILATQISPENVNTYLDDALNRVVALVQDAATQYRSEHPDITLVGKELEDSAFREFDLKAIDEILPHIQKKKDEMDEIRGWMKTHIQYIPGMIVPPEGPGPRAPAGGGGLEKPGVKNRLQTLLYILKTDGLDLESIALTEGSVRENMWRRESYIDVSVPSLKRIVLVCDEENNASYFFDTDKLNEIAAQGGNPLVLTMTKPELRELIKTYPGIGYPLVYTHKWIENVRALLYDPIPVQDEERSPIAAGEHRVSTAELDPWRGFWTDQGTGWHYSTVRLLARKLSECFEKEITQTAVASAINKFKCSFKTVIEANGKTIPSHAFEELFDKGQKFFLRPQAASKDNPETNDWKGFILEEGIHFGPKAMIYSRLGVAEGAVNSRVDWKIVRVKDIRSSRGQECDGFACEDIVSQPKMKELLALPRVESEGEWKGFYFFDDVRKHFGSVTAIGTKIKRDFGVTMSLGDTSLLTRDILPPLSEFTRDVRSKTGKRTGYPYEDIIAATSDYLRTKKESQERGELFMRNDELWGHLAAIAAHLHLLHPTTLHTRVNRYLKLGGTLEHVEFIAHSGETAAYRVSDIEPLAEGLKRIS